MQGKVKTDPLKQKSVQNFDIESLGVFKLNVQLSEAQCREFAKQAARANRKKDKQEKKAIVSTEVRSEDRSVPTNEPCISASMKMIKIEHEEERPSTSSGMMEDRSVPTNEPFIPPPAKMIKIEHEEERPSTSSGIRDGETFKEVGTPLKMVIFLKGYPIEKLDEDKVRLIKAAILNEALKCKPSNGPQFTDYYYEGGVVYIVCANEISKQWLKKTIPSLTPWQGAILRVCEPTEIKIFKAQVQIEARDLFDVKGPERIIYLFKIQNPGLNVEEWSIIKSTVEKKHTTIDFYIDEKSFETFSKTNYKANFGPAILTFKMLGKYNMKIEDNSN